MGERAERAFFDEHQIYELLTQAGLRVPRHDWVDRHDWHDAVMGPHTSPLFEPEADVVVKGQADELWHKSEADAVRFVRGAEVEATIAAMRPTLAGWRGALVCERVDIARSSLPSEGFMSLGFRQGLWVAVVGQGGLAVEALGELSPPLIWPLALMSSESALAELERHLLGRTWLGTVRGTKALTTRAELEAFVAGLWRLAELAARAGLCLIEVNPLVLDRRGNIVALDGVGAGQVGVAAPRRAPKIGRLVTPRRVGLLGVSKGEGPGRVIAENLIRSKIETIFIKPGVGDSFMGRPCVPDISTLMDAPLDLLVVAVPAHAAVAVIEGLIAQGGGAEVVGLVAGGIGDGADREGLGARVSHTLTEARRQGRWTPTVVGPNWLGEVVPALALDTTFIPADRWAPELKPGSLALISQSGAFVLSRLASRPGLKVSVALTLGNQLDLDAADVLGSLPPEIEAVGLYLEGLSGDALGRACMAIVGLRRRGVRVVVYRAGQSEAGHVAAASHTGAIAGDDRLEVAALRRAGASLAETMQAFESALAWLSTYPGVQASHPVVVSNAGFETVCAADRMPLASLLDPQPLATVLDRHGLSGLVAPRLPLDLTPMADIDAWLDVVKVLAGVASPESSGAAHTSSTSKPLVLGLVPFTPRLVRERVADLVAGLRALACPVAVVVDAGTQAPWLTEPLQEAGVLVFGAMEEALAGLMTLAD